jgi:hypothetical protein
MPGSSIWWEDFTVPPKAVSPKSFRSADLFDRVESQISTVKIDHDHHEQCWSNAGGEKEINAVIGQLGAGLNDVIRTWMDLTSTADADALVHGEIFKEVQPAAGMVVVATLLDPRWKVEIEAEAVISG